MSKPKSGERPSAKTKAATIGKSGFEKNGVGTDTNQVDVVASA